MLKSTDPEVGATPQTGSLEITSSYHADKKKGGGGTSCKSYKVLFLPSKQAYMNYKTTGAPFLTGTSADLFTEHVGGDSGWWKLWTI